MIFLFPSSTFSSRSESCTVLRQRICCPVPGGLALLTQRRRPLGVFPQRLLLSSSWPATLWPATSKLHELEKQAFPSFLFSRSLTCRLVCTCGGLCTWRGECLEKNLWWVQSAPSQGFCSVTLAHTEILTIHYICYFSSSPKVSQILFILSCEDLIFLLLQLLQQRPCPTFPLISE